MTVAYILTLERPASAFDLQKTMTHSSLEQTLEYIALVDDHIAETHAV